MRDSTIGFSDALAGRGNDINSAIGAFVPLVRNLGPVAHNLASRNTVLRLLFAGPVSFLKSLRGSALRRPEKAAHVR